MKEVRVTGKDRSPMIHLPLLKAVISPTNIVAREFRLASLQIRDPEFDVSMDRNETLNLSSLIPKNQTGSASEKKGESNAPKEEQGANGREIHRRFDPPRRGDRPVRRRFPRVALRHQTGDIRVDVDGLGTEEGKRAAALLSFSTEAGETVELKGSLSLTPLGSEGTIALAKVVLKKYARTSPTRYGSTSSAGSSTRVPVTVIPGEMTGRSSGSPAWEHPYRTFGSVSGKRRGSSPYSRIRREGRRG